ncbi:MAG TPA: AMP-binding protein [Myxococcales bacterium LLY-WYZ-16_1]|nr:AMP-binding protein [Myxococcales bacterium LLY-WYZ-16_1]
MYDFIARWAEIAPDRTAIEEVRTGRTWTFARLDERARRLAAAFREGLGLEPGDTVALLCQGRGEVFEALCAAAKAQVSLVPLNWRLAARELAHIVEDSGARALVYGDGHREVAQTLFGGRAMLGVALDASLDAAHSTWDGLIDQAQPRASEPSVDLEDVPLILYTSGTTGHPKGAMIPWRQILFNAINTVIAADLAPTDATLACLPLFHTGGLHALATPTLYRGGKVLLAPSFDANEATALLRGGRATTTIAVPTMYEMMADAGLLAPGAKALPRALLCGGAPVTHQLAERFHAEGLPLRQGYGLTEVGPNCFTLSPPSGPDRVGTVGYAAFHGEARLVDETGQPVEPGTPGELWLRGPHVTRGYVGNPKATAAALRPDGWFKTGDLLVQNERGVFSVVGRLKDMFISGGENVYPAEVENLLVEHPDIQSAAVVGVSDPKWGQVGLAVLVPERPDAPPEAQKLAGWLKAQIARYKVPKHWRFVSSYPLNATGKVEKKQLQTQYEKEITAARNDEEVES